MNVDGAVMARAFARGMLLFSEKHTIHTRNALLAVQRIAGVSVLAGDRCGLV